MANVIFPQSSDWVYAKRTEGEPGLQDVVSSAAFNFVKSGLAVEGTSGLDITFGSGAAIVGGTLVELDTNTSATVANNATSYVYLTIPAGGGDADTAVTDEELFEARTTPTRAPESLLLAKVRSSSGSITQTRDMRWMQAGASMTRVYTGSALEIGSTSLSDLPLGLPFDSRFAPEGLVYGSRHAFQAELHVQDEGGGLKVALKERIGGGSEGLLYRVQWDSRSPAVGWLASGETLALESWKGTRPGHAHVTLWDGMSGNELPDRYVLQWAKESSSGGNTRLHQATATIRRAVSL